MVNYIQNANKLNLEDEKLQNTFKELFTLNLQRYDYRKELDKPHYKFHGQIRSRYSMKFLKNNVEWLK